jgi:hypothetical protein
LNPVSTRDAPSAASTGAAPANTIKLVRVELKANYATGVGTFGLDQLMFV